MAARQKKPAATKTEPAFKIIRTAKCQTISKKSTLTYNLSRDDEANICIRISNNSGGGFFSNEWIRLDDIIKLIGDSPIKSYTLSDLFVGKSVNTHSFLIAVLLHEGVLSPCPGKHWHYEFATIEKLMKNIDK